MRHGLRRKAGGADWTKSQLLQGLYQRRWWYEAGASETQLDAESLYEKNRSAHPIQEVESVRPVHVVAVEVR